MSEAATDPVELTVPYYVLRERRPTPALKELPEKDRPRERLLAEGGGALSEAELLAVLLRTGKPGQSAVAMGQELLDESGGLAGLVEASLSSLHRPFLRDAKAATLLAAIELGRRLARCQLPERDLLDHPAAVADYVWLRYGRIDQEVVGVFFLDVRNRLQAEREIFRGTLDRTLVEPRTILREALVQKANAILLFHTHPSGDPSPSTEDLLFTERMRKAAKLIGVGMADHMIVGNGGRWVSLKRRGNW